MADKKTVTETEQQYRTLCRIETIGDNGKKVIIPAGTIVGLLPSIAATMASALARIEPEAAAPGDE